MYKYADSLMMFSFFRSLFGGRPLLHNIETHKKFPRHFMMNLNDAIVPNRIPGLDGVQRKSNREKCQKRNSSGNKTPYNWRLCTWKISKFRFCSHSRNKGDAWMLKREQLIPWRCSVAKYVLENESCVCQCVCLCVWVFVQMWRQLEPIQYSINLLVLLNWQQMWSNLCHTVQMCVHTHARTSHIAHTCQCTCNVSHIFLEGCKLDIGFAAFCTTLIFGLIYRKFTSFRSQAYANIRTPVRKHTHATILLGGNNFGGSISLVLLIISCVCFIFLSIWFFDFALSYGFHSRIHKI